MKQLLIINILAIFAFACVTDKHETTGASIWFNQPATTWNEAIPIGNGTLGGMVYGGIESDTIKINEETLWSGGPRDLQNYDAINHLPKIRQLLLDGKTKKAEKLINKTMLGEYNESYMPMGDLVINSNPNGKAENYTRQLDLENGLVTVDYSIENIQYKKEVFASFPDKTIVVKLGRKRKPSKVIRMDGTVTRPFSFLVTMSYLVMPQEILMSMLDCQPHKLHA